MCCFCFCRIVCHFICFILFYKRNTKHPEHKTHIKHWLINIGKCWMRRAHCFHLFTIKKNESTQEPTMYHLKEEKRGKEKKKQLACNKIKKKDIWSRSAKMKCNEKTSRQLCVLQSTHKCHIICTTILRFSSRAKMRIGLKCNWKTWNKVVIVGKCLFCYAFEHKGSIYATVNETCRVNRRRICSEFHLGIWAAMWKWY